MRLGNLEIGIGLAIFVILAFSFFGFAANSTYGDVAQALATILTGAIATAVVAWQIHAASAQANQDRMSEIKTQLYRDIAQRYHAAIGPIIELGSIGNQHDTQLMVHEETNKLHIPTLNYEKIRSLKDAKDRCVHELIGLIEDWAVVDHRLSMFKLAINCANHDVNKTFQSLLELVMPHLPMQITEPHSQYFTTLYEVPPSNIRTKIEQLGSELSGHASTLVGYAGDFRDQMQMTLVGELFGASSNNVEIRKPTDDKYKVLTVDKWQELEKYFLNETEFGKRLSS